MTRQKHLKQLVRARMEKTGERYAAARRHVVRDTPSAASAASASQAGVHLTGNVPATTALRILLTAVGVRAPHTAAPFTEAMLFGVAGGIGAGVFSFVYEKENFASFFVAGRHDWGDHTRYLRNAATRLGAETTVAESSGVKPAAQALAKALAGGQPCIVWVDAAALPHRAVPGMMSGGSYHLVTVYEADDSAGTALIGDLSDEPMTIPLDALAAARARIKKDRNRVLSLTPPAKVPRLGALVRGGLQACHAGLLGGTALGGAKTNFSLEAFRVWGNRLHGSRDKESWDRVFTPGSRLWRGLTSINDYIEHCGTGGGLSRPLFAEFLEESGEALGSGPLSALAERYAELGRRWSELADAALPSDVPAMREAKELLARKSELLHSGGPEAIEERRLASARLDELAGAAQERFPLAEADADTLRADLQLRVLGLYEGEVAAHEAMARVMGD